MLVAPGTYTGAGNRGIDFGGVDLVLLSEGGAESTVIDCEGENRGFKFHSGETAASLVSGFTIRNGWAPPEGQSPYLENGGGIYCLGSSPTLTNCSITGNSADNYGGGIYCDQSSSSMLTNCTIVGNTAESGGGLDCSYGEPMLTNCTIAENTAESGGGGLTCWYGSPTLTNCTIVDNTADAGGGIYTHSSSLAVTNCSIVGNRARGNNRWDGGGGIYCSRSYLSTLTNCTIAGNTAETGGGIRYSRATLNSTLTNCTITSNTAAAGGGIYFDASSPTLTNCILWNDTSAAVYVDEESEPTLTHCNVQGGYAGEGNIDADPRFRSFRSFDYVLSPGSPCVDSGTGQNDGIPWSRVNSAYGQHNSQAPDMGAYGGPGNLGWVR